MDRNVRKTCLVSGAAGFIGSHLCEELLARGHRVVGLDCFTPYYDRRLKETNISAASLHPDFSLHEADLRTDDLGRALDSADVVFHLAAQPGLLRSWSEFDSYLTCNVQATHNLLEASLSANVQQFIHASTSSVYGRVATGDEDSALQPISPYGITKLAAENLC